MKKLLIVVLVVMMTIVSAAPALADSLTDERAGWDNPNARLGDRVAYQALLMRGIPYVYGGTSSRGLDCSGLSYVVARHFGASLPRSADAQARVLGLMSRDAWLLPGDLVFFANTYRRGISHVGIYIGGGLFVDASRPGTRVDVENLRSSYWWSHYTGASRPFGD